LFWKVVGCKWVFKKKNDATGIRHKARLVAKSFSQVEGVDFKEVFSPVVKQTSIRVLLLLVAMKNLELEQLDVKTAFLHGDPEEKIYMQQSQGGSRSRVRRTTCAYLRSHCMA
jgi:hypothetical protein